MNCKYRDLKVIACPVCHDPLVVDATGPEEMYEVYCDFLGASHTVAIAPLGPWDPKPVGNKEI